MNLEIAAYSKKIQIKKMKCQNQDLIYQIEQSFNGSSWIEAVENNKKNFMMTINSQPLAKMMITLLMSFLRI